MAPIGSRGGNGGFRGAARRDHAEACPKSAYRRPPTNTRGMTERNTQQVQQTRDDLRRVVGFSVADEIEKLDRLMKSGSVTDDEFARLRAS